MSAVAVRTPNTLDVEHLNTVLDWVADRFDADGLYPACETAARRAVLAGLIYGPLWEEIGVATLAGLYRLRRIHPVRKPSAERDPRDPYGTLWFYVPSVKDWKNLGDLTRKDCREIAADREMRRVASERERDFFEALAKRIADGKTLRECLTPEQVSALRESRE